MEKLEQLYEGKAKKVFKTDDPHCYIVEYKDDATALNGLKRGTIAGKGVINNRVSNHLMRMLEQNGIPTHLVEEISDRETIVKKVTIIPLEVIVRNIAAGRSPRGWAFRRARRSRTRYSNTAIRTTRSAIRSSTITTSLRWALRRGRN